MLEDRIVPASYTVNTLSDAASQFTIPKTGEVFTSLRAAINLANADGDSTESIGFSVGGTISLDPSLGALPALAGKTFTIDGTGITVDAGGNSGIFVINSDATAEIDNFVLTNAASAPALTNDGTLNLNGDTVSYSLVSALNNTGTSALNGVNMSNNQSASSGGAINNTGTLTIRGDSTFDSNETTGTASGGAIYSVGTLSVDNTTFSSNQAGGNGGAIVTAAGTNDITDTNGTVVHSVVVEYVT